MSIDKVECFLRICYILVDASHVDAIGAEQWSSRWPHKTMKTIFDGTIGDIQQNCTDFYLQREKIDNERFFLNDRQNGHLVIKIRKNNKKV